MLPNGLRFMTAAGVTGVTYHNVAISPLPGLVLEAPVKLSGVRFINCRER